MDKNISLPQEEIDVLEFVKKYYFDIYTAKTLEKICHLEEPFHIARNGVAVDKNSDEIIEKEHIRTYYLKIAQRYDISREKQNNVKLYLNELLNV